MNEMRINGEELVFGLDIGTRNVVGTVGYRQGERFVVAAQEIRKHQTRAMLDGQIHDINRVAATISDIRQALQVKTGLKLEEVCIAAAGRVLKTMTVHVDMDLDKERNVTKEDIGTLVSIGVEQALVDFQEKNDTEMHFYCVGYSVMRYYLNGMWMGQLEHHKAKSLGADMIATFLPDDVVDGLYSAIELAGLKVANLTLEPIAAIRVAIPEKFRLLNIAMIDVGAGTSDISITNDGSVVAFGMLPRAGDSLTELLAKACLIDFATAEKIKIAAAQQEKVVYEDIMGLEQTITADEIVAICQPEIERMAKLTAEAIKELNGGTSPSAVFIVGGGGRIRGFDKNLAAELGLDPSRVALRGEEIMRDIDFPDDAIKDSTIITPIGICLTYYEQNNNFIYITFNGNRIKLYDNNKLTVMDAAMQAAFTRERLFPRRGKELRYTVNGKNRVTKGEYGESAHIYVNGEEVNLSFSIKANDQIILEESTIGEPAWQRVSDLAEYCKKIVVTVNGDEMQLPKPVQVNETVVTAEYMIQEGDAVEISSQFTYDGFLELMGISVEDMVVFVNDVQASSDSVICDGDKITVKSTKELAQEKLAQETSDKEISDNREFDSDEIDSKGSNEHDSNDNAVNNTEANFESHKSQAEAAENQIKQRVENRVDTDETTSETNAAISNNIENPEVSQSTIKTDFASSDNITYRKLSSPPIKDHRLSEADIASDSIEKSESDKVMDNSTRKIASEDTKENVVKKEQQNEEEYDENNRKIIVIINQKPVVMRGKKTYTFVDIFDYINFDTSKMRGAGIATLVNGKDAQYTQVLHNGDKIEVYWKEKN